MIVLGYFSSPTWKSHALVCGYLCTKPSPQVNTLQQLEVRFPHWWLRCGQMRDFFKYTFGVADLPVGNILFYLKDRLCLSLPPSDAAVNCNKRIWLNEFPIQTLSCGQRTLWIWFLRLASWVGVESYVFTIAGILLSLQQWRWPLAEKAALGLRGSRRPRGWESCDQAISC